jgi:hypothetical protein
MLPASINAVMTALVVLSIRLSSLSSRRILQGA